MAGDVVNIKVFSSFKLRSGLKGNYHEICHYSYNLPLPAIRKMRTILISLILLPILSFAQEKCEKDSIRMTHGIVSMTKITLEFESDTIVKSDTIFEIVRYDKKGRLIEEKYQIGTAVLHK